MRPAAGYSGRSLAQKLGIRESDRIVVMGEPPEYDELIGPLPGVERVKRPGNTVDLVHLFVTRRADLERHLGSLRKSLRPDAVVWVSWPKRTAKVPTNITEDTIREVALPLGFVDIKVCAVSEVWSGLKLVIRKELRMKSER
jgi:hypothetical protein